MANETSETPRTTVVRSLLQIVKDGGEENADPEWKAQAIEAARVLQSLEALPMGRLILHTDEVARAAEEQQALHIRVSALGRIEAYPFRES